MPSKVLSCDHLRNHINSYLETLVGESNIFGNKRNAFAKSRIEHKSEVSGYKLPDKYSST